ncbi:hypothetical protein QYF36_020940 [Acer negundo]|nr:hypothetical protein QYF36_020940 [Acer negundo]
MFVPIKGHRNHRLWQSGDPPLVKIGRPIAVFSCHSLNQFFERSLACVALDLPSVSTIFANINSILMLNGTNFKDWKENIEIVLGCMDLDLALRSKQSASLTDASSPDGRRTLRSGIAQIA